MNTKVRSLVFTVFILLTSMAGHAQKGIYLTSADYAAGKLSYTEGNIHLHHFWDNGAYVTVDNNGTKSKLAKSNIYGYKDHSNTTRFYKNKEYKVLDTGNICIYVVAAKVAQSKGFKVLNTYYFSATANGAILPLSLSNIRYAYKGNDKFLDLADLYFANGDIQQYDEQHHTFRVNYVYAKAMGR